MIEDIITYICYINRKYEVFKKYKTYEPTIINLYATYRGLRFLRLV